VEGCIQEIFLSIHVAARCLVIRQADGTGRLGR
jgi:hypothetical protein